MNIKAGWIGLAFGIAALVISIVAIFVPFYGIRVSLVALVCAVIGAAAGDRIFATASSLITGINLFFLSPILWLFLGSLQVAEQTVIVAGISLALMAPFVAMYLHATDMEGMVLVAGVIGIAMVIAFLGVMVVWVPAPPLIIIVVCVMALLIWDFIQTLRYGEGGKK